jgi:Bacterial SH3 domain
MTAVATYDEKIALGNFSGFTTQPEFGMPVGYRFKRDTGFFSGGLLSGILTILLLLYFGGGSPALQPITFVANKKAKERYLEDRRILEEIRRGDPENRGPGSGTILYEINRAGVNMRVCPGLDCEPIYTLQPGMQIIDAGGREIRDNIDWIRVNVNGREGWVSRRYLQLPGGPTPPPPGNPIGPDSLRVRISDIWLRECAGLNCREIEPLPLGALVANLGQSRPVDGDWWIKIRYGAREGWVIRNTLE